MSHKECLSCRGEVTLDSDFCPHCGMIFETAGSVFCDTHPSIEATGVCIICRKTVCRECGRRKDRRWFCPEHLQVKVEQDWVLMFESPDINEAELVRSVLESTGAHVVVRNFGPNNVVWEGGGDSLFSRQALNRQAKVFVPIPEYVAALSAFREWESATKKQS